MNHPPFFSIIIPTYNSEKTFDHCLESIVSQSFKDFEILVMDGLSTDNTLKIAQSRPDERIKIRSEKDKGIYDAMNKGILLAQGKWLYFLGSDDYLFSDTVLHQIHRQIENKEIDVIYGNILNPLYNEKYAGKFDFIQIYQKNIGHQSIFFNRKLFDRTGLFNLKYPILSDYDHNLKWFLDKRTKIVYIDLIIAFFGDTGCSTTSSRQDPFNRDRGYNYLVSGFRSLPKLYFLKCCRRELRNKQSGLGRKIGISLMAFFILFRI